MGGLFSERSGVINIALEGLMLVGSFAAAAVASQDRLSGRRSNGGSAARVLRSAAIYGLAVITLRADQIVAGTAINMLAAGITPFVCKLLYDSTGSTPALPIDARFQWSPMIWAWAAVFGDAWIDQATPLGFGCDLRESIQRHWMRREFG